MNVLFDHPTLSRRSVVSCGLVLLILGPWIGGVDVRASEPPIPQLLKTIARASEPECPIESVQQAWERLAACPESAIPLVLRSVDASDSLVTVNWYSTAIDRMVAQTPGGTIGKATCQALSEIAEDAARPGFVRRIALLHLEPARPGFQQAFIDRQLGDAEFGMEAVAAHLARADNALADNDRARAIAICRGAFEQSTDFDQTIELAEKLEELGETAPLIPHLGLLVDWSLVGPFPGKDMTAFDIVYPPQQEVDLSKPVAYEGASYPWRRPERADSDWRFDLKKLIGNENDCVAFAYTEFTVPERQDVELRAGADDTLAVWHNGEPVYSFPHFGNHLHADRHRATLHLTPGKNTLLLKVAEAKIVPGRVGGGPKKWEFAARLVDSRGRGVVFATENKGK